MGERLWLLLLLISGAVFGSEGERIDFHAAGIPIAEALVTLSELSGHTWRLDEALLDADIAGSRCHLLLQGTSGAGARQALAHQLDCWWVRTADGTLFTRQDTLTAKREPIPRSYSTTFVDIDQAEQRVRRLMAPWLADPKAGLAVYAPHSEWIATLDREGHQVLKRTFTLLENPRANHEALVPANHLPVAARSDDQWQGTQLLSALHAWAQDRGAAYSLRSLQRDPGSWHLREEAGSDPRFLAWQVARGGVSAEWYHGVLCVGGTPQDRRHPAARRRLLRYPVSQFGNTARQRAVLASVRAQVPDLERFTGWGLIHLTEQNAALIAADTRTILTVLEQLDAAERTSDATPAITTAAESTAAP